jgi:hypothetical protein
MLQMVMGDGWQQQMLVLAIERYLRLLRDMNMNTAVTTIERINELLLIFFERSDNDQNQNINTYDYK